MESQMSRFSSSQFTETKDPFRNRGACWWAERMSTKRPSGCMSGCSSRCQIYHQAGTGGTEGAMKSALVFFSAAATKARPSFTSESRPRPRGASEPEHNCCVVAIRGIRWGLMVDVVVNGLKKLICFCITSLQREVRNATLPVSG